MLLATILLFPFCIFNTFPKAEADYGWTHLANTPSIVGQGASIVTDLGSDDNYLGKYGRYVYATGGENTTNFWRYDIFSNTWTMMAPTPGLVGPGSSMTMVNNFTSFVILALQGGNSTGFWGYNINQNSWSTLPNTPEPVGPGGSITSLINNTEILALRGQGTNDFWRFNLTSNQWTSLANTLGPVGAGGGLSAIDYGTNPQGDFVGAVQGSTGSGFWIYDADNDSWKARTNVPISIGPGGGIGVTGAPDGAFSVVAGGGSRQVWCVSDAILNGTWTRQTDFPVAIGNGGAIATQNYGYNFPDPGAAFVLQGSGSKEFYKDTTICNPDTLSHPHITFTHIFSNQTSVNIGGKAKFVATVIDPLYPINPRGTILWSDGGAGGTFALDPCDTVYYSNGISCSAIYSSSGGARGVTINATFVPDFGFLPSHGTSLLTVLNPNSSTGLFCGKPLKEYAQLFNGTSQDDVIFGTNGNDLIMGNGGDDVIWGNGGDDCILGGAGNDTIYGGPGNDYVDGGSGDDKITGNSGNDTIFGSNGNDIIDGGGGDDKIYGGAGNDTINGSDGNDYINAGDGDDKIYAGAGNDEIHGMDGNDYINAGDGDDTIFGGAGNDEIHGGNGNDYINGGDGTDKCFDTLGNNTKINCEQ